MTKKEQSEQDEKLFAIYCGMLYGSMRFEEGEPVPLFYHFGCPEFARLRRQYGLEKIAGKGGEFSMALKLCRYFAPQLLHEGDFSLTNRDVPCDALSLLGYAYGRKDRGLNCACKAKILQECCLALGIHARRVGLYPNSPYDIDNHVVTEIYDRRLKKWCMLDLTNGGYFTDGERPLSCLEMRSVLAVRGKGTAVLPHQREKDLAALAKKNAGWNVYYAKNSFYFTVETVSGFGTGSARDAYLAPKGFDCRARTAKSAEFLLEKAQEWEWDAAAVDNISRWAAEARSRAPLVGSTAMWAEPAMR